MLRCAGQRVSRVVGREQYRCANSLPRRFFRVTASTMSGDTSVKKVQPHEAAELLKSGVKYLDVRTPEEFAAGHADGAINIPISFQGMVANPEFVQQVQHQFPDKEQQLIVGCKAGGRSARACAMLSQDYKDLIDNTQGWDGWIAANLPVSK